MKNITNYIYIFALMLIFSSLIVKETKAQKIDRETAKSYAKEFMSDLKSRKISVDSIEIKEKKQNNEISYYIINFKKGGYILLSGDRAIAPIIAYSKTGKFIETKRDSFSTYWLSSVEKHIEYQKKKKRNSIEKISTNSAKLIFISYSGLTIRPLLETAHSSRWANWYPYSIEMPNQVADYGCVPIAMAQIIKYHNYPIQGQGIYNGIDFSRQWYNYAGMPFRLTHCGNGQANCNEGNFNIIDGITNEEMHEVSRLIYQCGIVVNTDWTVGTNGPPSDWAQALESYFNYSDNWQYLDENYIANNYSSFKKLVRNELINKRPVLFVMYARHKGHAAVIDGVENSNYFHFTMGRGGADDAYYYLYNIDNDAIHDISPLNYAYSAIIGISPKCSTTINLNLDGTTVHSYENKVYEAKETINASNFKIEGNGISGARVSFQAGEGVTLGTNFEVQKGSEVFITTIRCK